MEEYSLFSMSFLRPPDSAQLRQMNDCQSEFPGLGSNPSIFLAGLWCGCVMGCSTAVTPEQGEHSPHCSDWSCCSVLQWILDSSSLYAKCTAALRRTVDLLAPICWRSRVVTLTTVVQHGGLHLTRSKSSTKMFKQQQRLLSQKTYQCDILSMRGSPTHPPLFFLMW